MCVNLQHFVTERDIAKNGGLDSYPKSYATSALYSIFLKLDHTYFAIQGLLIYTNKSLQ